MIAHNNRQNRLYFMQPDKTSRLFWLCWLAYFASYLGRLNYAAAMAEIIQAEGFTGAQAGLVSTGFFICYGAGQMVSGYLGDKLRPERMITAGLVCSALCNGGMAFLRSPSAMLTVWCVNGAIQSLLWTPILRIIAEYFQPQFRKKACVNMATTYPVATLFVYAGSAGLILLGGWRSVFAASAVALAAVALIWQVGFARLRGYRTVPAEEDRPAQPQDSAPVPSPAKARLPWLVLALFCLALMFQGVLRDGIMTWVPAFLDQNFPVGTVLAILCTTVLPVVNLIGVYASQGLYKLLRSEPAISALLFALAAAAGGLLLLWASGHSLVLSLVSFAVMTSSMMGVNLMLVSFIPTYFAKLGRVSFVAGLLNSSVYIGSSIATYGIGAVADALGWHVLLAGLLAVAVAGAGACLLAVRGWRRFNQTK